jgi:hypothetical protein
VGSPQLPGTALLLITPAPQQVVPGSSTGVTLINPGDTPIILSTDAIPTEANSFTLPPNGASLPISSGPLWASVSSGMATLNVYPGILNVSNPNVLVNTVTGTTAFGPQPVVAFTEYDIALPSNTQTLFVSLQNTDVTPTVCEVVGAQSDYTYRSNQTANLRSGGPLSVPFYLKNPDFGGSGEVIKLAVIPMIPGYDTSIKLFFGPALTPAAIATVVASTNKAKESDFYTGQMQTNNTTLAALGSALLVSGPIRLLTADVEAVGAGTVGSIQVTGPGGANIITRTGGSGTIHFPDNTILSDGNDLIAVASAGTVHAGVTYAYP